MKSRKTITKNISRLLGLSLLLLFFAGCTLYMDDLDGYGGEVVENGDGFTSPITISDSIGTVTYQFTEGTIYYQEPSRSYISNVTTDTTAHTVEYTLAGDTPAKWIPQKGGCITTDQLDIFKEGLNHQVDIVEKTGNGYLVKAHVVGLKDVYDRLDLDYSAYLVFDTIPDVDDYSSDDDYATHTVALRPVKKKAAMRTGVDGADDDIKTATQPAISFGLEFGSGKGESPNSLMYDIINTSPKLTEAAKQVADEHVGVTFDEWLDATDEERSDFLYWLGKKFKKKNLISSFSEFKREKWDKAKERLEKLSDLNKKASRLQRMWGLDKLDKIKSILDLGEVTGDFYIGTTANLYFKIDGHIHISSSESDENREEGSDYSKVSILSWIELHSGVWELGNIGFKFKIPIFTTQQGAKAFFNPKKLNIATFLVGPVLCSFKLGGSLSFVFDGSAKNIPAAGYYDKYTIPLLGLEFDSEREGLDQFRMIDVPTDDDINKDVSDGKKKSTNDQSFTLGLSFVPDFKIGLAVYETLIVNVGIEVTMRTANTWKRNSAYSDFKIPTDEQTGGNDTYELSYEGGYNTRSISLRPHADVTLDLKATDMTLGSWAVEKPLTFSDGDYDWPQLTTTIKTDWTNTTDSTTAFIATISLLNKSYFEKPSGAPTLLIFKKDDGYVIKDGVPVEVKAGEFVGKFGDFFSNSFSYNLLSGEKTVEYKFTLPGGIMAGEYYAVPSFNKGTGNAPEHEIGFSKPTVFSRETIEGLSISELYMPFVTNDYDNANEPVKPGFGKYMNVPLRFKVEGFNEPGTYENIAVKFIATKPNKTTQTLGPYILKMGTGLVEGEYLYLLTGMPKADIIKDFNYSTASQTAYSQVEVQLIGLLPGYSHVSNADKEDYATTLSSTYIGITSGYACGPFTSENDRQNEGAWLIGFCPDVQGYGWYYYVDASTKYSYSDLIYNNRVTGYYNFDEIYSYCRNCGLGLIE